MSEYAIDVELEKLRKGQPCDGLFIGLVYHQLDTRVRELDEELRAEKERAAKLEERLEHQYGGFNDGKKGNGGQ
jgi:hypothetical protein